MKFKKVLAKMPVPQLPESHAQSQKVQDLDTRNICPLAQLSPQSAAQDILGKAGGGRQHSRHQRDLRKKK